MRVRSSLPEEKPATRGRDARTGTLTAGGQGIGWIVSLGAWGHAGTAGRWFVSLSF